MALNEHAVAQFRLAGLKLIRVLDEAQDERRNLNV